MNSVKLVPVSFPEELNGTLSNTRETGDKYLLLLEHLYARARFLKTPVNLILV